MNNIVEKVKLQIRPYNKIVYLVKGSFLLEGLIKAGVFIETPCGGKGRCGKCVIKLEQGRLGEPCISEILHLGMEKIKEGYRLACCARIEDESIISFSLSLSTGLKILTSERRKKEDYTARSNYYGIAVDIGTTTVAASLVDIGNTYEIDAIGYPNPQVYAGYDIISRINFCRSRSDGLEILHRDIINLLNSIIKEFMIRNDIPESNITRFFFCGNSVMQQIVCKKDPSELGEFPFRPAFKIPPVLKTNDIGINLPSTCAVRCFPQIGGFVGGDAVADAVAVEIYKSEMITMLVDIGTNGEILLFVPGKGFYAASMAAGPAFEGMGISCGMRAMNGAIERIRFEDDVKIEVIGNTAPRGICGSGLIDILAEMLRYGIVDINGCLNDPDSLRGKIPDTIVNRIVNMGDQTGFVVVEEDVTEDKNPITITQKDIRQLQLANAAIRSGITLLLKRAGITHDKVHSIYLAGAFGNFIQVQNAIRIGLLPDLSSISFIGNAALYGVVKSLINENYYDEALRLVDIIEHVNLSEEKEFHETFIDALIFPLNKL